MNKLDNYIIQFGTLETGQHEFVYRISNDFFEQFEYSEVEDGDIEVRVELIRKTLLLELTFFIKGNVTVQCDRCLDSFSLPIESEEYLSVKFGEEDSDISDVDDVMIISQTRTELPIWQHIFEYIHLALPIRRVHPHDKNGNSTCDPEMIAKLEEHLVQKEISVDPRWDQLKTLFN